MPTTGPVQQFPVVQGSGQAEDNPQPVPVPPGPRWNRKQIVTGFLAASASFRSDPGVASQYLAPSVRWQPGWAATVVGPDPKITSVPLPKNIVPGQQGAYVDFTGQRLATLTSSGQYLTSSGSREADRYTLIKIDGQWRISHMPSPTSLILTQADFQRDYRPRNLYFFSPSGSALVPDPVFVPQRTTNAETAHGLAEGLLKDPTGWLSGATRTDFPPRTKLLGVKILGTSAVVNLGGSAGTASPKVLREMAAQLVWTLTSSSYSPPEIHSVVLEINSVVQHPHGQQLILPAASPYSGMVPASSVSGAYFLSANGVKVLSGGTQSALQVPGPTGISQIPLTAIAVAPGGGVIAGISPEGKGCKVYSGALSRGAGLTFSQLSDGPCSSLSWDNQGDIWAAAGTHVWLLPPGGGGAVPVFLPGTPKFPGPAASLPPSETITALRVAPDDVRVAMIVRSNNGTAQVLLGAISRAGSGVNTQTYIGQSGTPAAIGTDIHDPTALTWYDADHVVVLGHGPEGPQLYDVPLTGGVSVPITTFPGTVSITSAGSQLVAGTAGAAPAGGQILWSSDLDATWRPVGPGSIPAYPG